MPLLYVSYYSIVLHHYTGALLYAFMQCIHQFTHGHIHMVDLGSRLQGTLKITLPGTSTSMPVASRQTYAAVEKYGLRYSDYSALVYVVLGYCTGTSNQ